MESEHILRYDKPASVWTEALPLGNGRIGAMVFGNPETERFALNEDTLWSGYPMQDHLHNAPQALERARTLMNEGKYAEAQIEIEQNFTGHFTEAYMPLGDLLVSRHFIGEITDYARKLDIESGVHTLSFSENGSEQTVKSYTICERPQALVVEYSSSAPGRISLSVSFNCPLRHETYVRDNTLTLEMECPSRAMPSYLGLKDPLMYSDKPEERGIRAAAMLRVSTVGGTIAYHENTVEVVGADFVRLMVCAQTSFNGYDKHPFLNGKDYIALCKEDIKSISSLDMDCLLKNHMTEFSALMNRVDFRIDEESDDIATDKRLEEFLEKRYDPRLYELLFNYGRYLMISGSRPNSQAMNLQGIWNESTVPPWSSNYTVNINTEMNYYPAEVANLSEMHYPLFDLIDKIAVNGEQTAREFYGVSGSVCHHNTDLWGRTNPMGDKRENCAMWSHWPMSLSWLCRHLYDHYLYTLDETFLKERALPVIRKAVEFLLNVMVKDDHGRLRVFPATSPENSFYYDGKMQSLAKSATMSNAITREILKNYLSILDILHIDEPMRERAADALPDIWPYCTGSQGQLLEWDSEYEEYEPHHRHTSHLYGLYPGTEISPERTPALAEACRKTLEMRGDDGTGWCLGWRICFWARLNDGNHAMKLLNNQLRLVRQDAEVKVMGGGTYPNMFDAHPPFQIDGNFGACAGICEMFLHSRQNEIDLLPAIPSDWKNGHMRGLKAIGNITVSVEFKNSKLSKYVIDILDARALPVNVMYKGRLIATIAETGRAEG